MPVCFRAFVSPAATTRHGGRRRWHRIIARELASTGQGANRAARLAGRFAAKQAVLKALGTGRDNGIAWTDVEIDTTDTGTPKVVLHNGPAKAVEGLGIAIWLVSTNHVVATVIGLNAVDSESTICLAAVYDGGVTRCQSD